MSEWIKCSEMMPPKVAHLDVWVVCSGTKQVHEAVAKGGKFFSGALSELGIQRITHWMEKFPKPLPPDAEGMFLKTIQIDANELKRLIDRFLIWKLPEDFSPDAGISFKRTFNDHMTPPMRHEPIGTNLLDARQAEAMLRYILELPEVSQ